LFEIRKKITRLSSARQAYGKYKHTAKARNITFQLTFDEFLKLVLAPCYLCGSVKLGRTSYSSDSKKGADTPTFKHNGIDRVNSTKGYVKKNVKPCCWKCNRMKSDLSIRGF